MSDIIKGYKITDKNMRCRQFQYEFGKKYSHNGKLELCGAGFHFCLQAAHCFNYYAFTSENRVFEIEASGTVITEGDKSATSEITFIRELTWEEVLKVANTGLDNTGVGNTGYSNTGYRNTGDRNTGDRNTGDRNTGYRNTGYSNTGDRNTGDRNTGDRNTGDRNTGGWNTGYRNTGDRNTGDRNTGDRNTGDSNTGGWNTGDRNTGDRNTGGWNTGYSNTGYSNTGDRNTGGFCTGSAPFPMFNKPSDWTEKDFLDSKVYYFLCQVDTKQWIPTSHMTEEEKEKYPSHKTAEGYLKDIPFKEAFQNAWHNWSASSRQAFIDLPNFDNSIFFEITGVNVDEK